jgi:hypothetical protein
MSGLDDGVSHIDDLAARLAAGWSLRDPALRPTLEEIVATEVRPEIAAVAREALEARGD